MESNKRGAAMKTFIIILVSLILFGCGSARKSEPIVKDVKLTNKNLIEGELSFYKNCNKCHPGGEGGLGPALNNKDIVPSALIKLQVREGLGKMPSFSEKEIPSEELDKIVGYIEFLQDRD
jgi:mono/diheme cytochrome c family protein